MIGVTMANDDRDMSPADAALLKRIRRAASKTPRRGDDKVTRDLAAGANSYERMCEGKKKIRTPEHAADFSKMLTERYGGTNDWYFCPFCHCYHLTSHATS